MNPGFADQFSRRVAHAVHALMEVRNDPGIGPYGPFKASEVVLYDGEALDARATGAALREAEKVGLAINIRGHWTATNLALDHCHEFEGRYIRETSE